jgi:hypothetical protein
MKSASSRPLGTFVACSGAFVVDRYDRTAASHAIYDCVVSPRTGARHESSKSAAVGRNKDLARTIATSSTAEFGGSSRDF